MSIEITYKDRFSTALLFPWCFTAPIVGGPCSWEKVNGWRSISLLLSVVLTVPIAIAMPAYYGWFVANMATSLPTSDTILLYLLGGVPLAMCVLMLRDSARVIVLLSKRRQP